MTQKLSTILGLTLATLLLAATLAVAADMGTVASVNSKAGTITLIGPDGESKDMKVSKDVLASLKRGDRIKIDKGKIMKMKSGVKKKK